MKGAAFSKLKRDSNVLSTIDCFYSLVVMGVVIAMSISMPAVVRSLLVFAILSTAVIHVRLANALMRPAGVSAPPSLLLKIMTVSSYKVSPMNFPFSIKVQRRRTFAVDPLRPER